MEKILKAAEALVAAIKEQVNGTATRSGNRTTPTRNYRGGNVEQDLIDVARRAVRYARSGQAFSKKERILARKVLKAFKATHSVVNTNGVDVWTHAGL